MMKIITKQIILLSLLLASSTSCSYYHEHAIRGTILDYDTKQPIVGAVVVVEYNISSSFLAPHSMSSIMDVRETLTNKEGNFAISSYTTLMAPIYEQIPSWVLIFKPGYASLEIGTTSFVGEDVQSQEQSWPKAKDLKYRISDNGIVEIPKLRTREERRLTMPSPVEDSEHEFSWYRKKQVEFIRLLNEERKSLGLSGEYNIQ